MNPQEQLFNQFHPWLPGSEFSISGYKPALEVTQIMLICW